MNAGEAYEKLPRFIPYAALPHRAWLLLTVAVRSRSPCGSLIGRGTQTTVIASHEAEELVQKSDRSERTDGKD